MLTRSTECPELSKQSDRQQTEEKLLISGLGGGGIITMGDILANAALRQYQHVAWFPCYNTMMRGGDSECCLIFSERAIPSPLAYKCTTVIAMGAVQATALEERVETGGLMLVEGIGEQGAPATARGDIRIQHIPATKIARGLGNPRNANLVMMGAYVELTKAIPPQIVEEEIERSFQLKGLQSALTAGKEAFSQGISFAQQLTG
jgi:2-oxoglutarate ferredoxin oxidoreductase subunit gamma